MVWSTKTYNTNYNKTMAPIGNEVQYKLEHSSKRHLIYKYLLLTVITKLIQTWTDGLNSTLASTL